MTKAALRRQRLRAFLAESRAHFRRDESVPAANGPQSPAPPVVPPTVREVAERSIPGIPSDQVLVLLRWGWRRGDWNEDGALITRHGVWVPEPARRESVEGRP